MDIDNPSPTFKYVKFKDNLCENRAKGILDVYHIPRMLLVTFGNLECYGADHLCTYIEEGLMPLIKPGVKEDGQHRGGSMVAGMQDVEKNGAICKQKLDPCLDVEVEDDCHFTSLWKGKGWLLKEESVEAIMVWPSDEEEVEATVPPIAVLDDTGTTSDSSESMREQE